MGNRNLNQDEMMNMSQNPYIDAQSGASSHKQSRKNGNNGRYNNPYMQNQSQNGMNNTNMQNNNSGLDMNALLKGALIGAAATYVLTNENVQKTIFKTFAKMGDFAEAGMEELKERYEDVKAEVEAEKQV